MSTPSIAADSDLSAVSDDPLRRAIDAACRRGEAACVAGLLAEWQAGGASRVDPAAVRAQAAALVDAVRARRRGRVDVARLLHEYPLDSREGLALMSLAEALLRIPDATTADRLIRDRLAQGDWSAHLGHSGSLLIEAATRGLLLGGRLAGAHAGGDPLGRLLARGGEPLLRRGIDLGMRLLGRQFVMGETIGGALARSRAGVARGYVHSFDMLGEAALTGADAERYARAYADAIEAIGRAAGGAGPRAGPGISLKLSALHPRYCRAQRARVRAELLPRLKALLLRAKTHDLGVNIDAEEADRLALSLDLFEALVADPDLAGWTGLGFVVQAYQKCCPAVIDHLLALARRSGRRLPLRLVKGAYWDSEIKRAQVDGLDDYPVYTRKAHTDLAYLVCAERLLAAPDAVYPQFATHNAQTLACLLRLAAAHGVDDYEFQCLHGMGEALYDGLAGSGHRCRIYAPVGSHATLLPYLVRRLLENGANTSFVNRLEDAALDTEALLADPLETVVRDGGTPHPAIPRPPALYGARRNSAGVDLAGEAPLHAFACALEALRARHWQAAPLLAQPLPGGAPGGAEGGRPVRNPARHAEIVGHVHEADAATVARAIEAAAAFAGDWHATPAARRAELLEKAADLFEGERDALCSLCIREAGKTWANAVAEVREAVDFCRYYAQQARGMWAETPEIPANPGGGGMGSPGPVACISPWNFPLAIFVGQVAGALAAGSPVLAKPAGQTPLVAALATSLFHRAGVPPAALQFLPGRGETVGAALVGDPRVRGVVFTGSGEVAQSINRALARRPPGSAEPRLIAETGGQNAMIVDASAHPEQVVRDVLTSAFDSAGQRCSALRVLCLQEEIAGPVLGLLRAAMGELAVGDPACLSTDVGPLIDAAARDAVEVHVAACRAAGRPVFRLPLPAGCAGGSFVPPTLIGIDTPADPGREVFGPVLHVLRYRHAELDALIEAINATGHGLTCGLHTRIDATVGRVAARIRAGNLYVNRNMIGAVVGVQPFGGEGRSGTGPKAGGPLYLPRLAGLGNMPPARFGALPPPSLPPSSPEGMEDMAEAQAAFRAFAGWARQGGNGGLAACCAGFAACSLLGWRIDLPGPTGESNRLTFAPRGRVLCLVEGCSGPDPAAGEALLLAQIAAALACGNRVLLVATPAVEALRERLPAAAAAKLACLPEAAALAACDALLFSGSVATEAALRARLAGLDGPLRPLLARRHWPRGWPLDRLLVERVLTVNTAAAGGNAALATLSA